MTNTPQPPFPPAATVSLASIQREYLEDLKCRVSTSHYKNVKAVSTSSPRRYSSATCTRAADPTRPLPQPAARKWRLEPTANLVVDSFGAMLAWAVG